MKNINRIVFFCLIVFTSLDLRAQQEQSLAFMTNVWQSNSTNPALAANTKRTVALPSLYFNLNSPDLTLNNLIVKGGANGKDLLTTDGLKLQNRINANVQFQTLGLTLPVNEALSLTVGHSVWADPSVNVKGDLIKLFVKGNGGPAFLGKTTAFGSSFNASIRSEIGVGAAYKMENLTLGARVKAQFGISGVFTKSNKLDITFNQNDYNMRFQNDFDVRTFSIDRFNTTKNIQDLLTNGLISNNVGVSFDLGGVYKIEKWAVSASIIDLAGSIKWKNEAKSYASKGDYTYKGINPIDQNNFFKFDSLSSTTFRDTLKKIIGLTENETGDYTQKLPTKIYLTGSYALNDKWTLGALFYGEFGGDETKTGVSLDATTKLFDILYVGATLGLRNKTFNNIGAHASATLGPVQVFAVTDNVLTVFNPYNTNNANGRVGLNLVF
ncbi:MAG: DUF5723 family protein [Saprospiraceae bacterium]|nr:DUF5723 family protein [Saprospiraceae bacterium]